MPAKSVVDTRKLMSDAKFYDGYSRYNDELERYETWDEAVDRVMDMHTNYYDHNEELQPYIDKVAKSYKEKRILGAQRALQFGGEQILKHQMKIYNCTSSYADRPEFFGELFYILLAGAGAGFSVQFHHVAKLPKIQARTKMAKIHVIEDSIEGWATALDILLASYFVGGGKYPEFEGRRVFFDTTKIRPRGSEISGGFKAPGPDGLRLALDRIEHLLQRCILTNNFELRPIDVYDISMHTADAVLSGGVRRSATICLFSPTDDLMITAKTGNWFIENPQRGRSNNSAVIVRNNSSQEQFHDIMKCIKEFGEPGFFFVESTEHTTNPCGEIEMFPQIDGKSGWQGCNLSEINGAMCTTEENFYKACESAAIIGTIQAGYTDFKFLDSTTKRIFDREALIGVSITGWMNNPKILFDEKILNKGADIVKETNKKIAKIIGINPAARATTGKPAGNASVILMTASGIHGEHSQQYIRNVTMTKDSEVAQLIMKNNPYMVENSVYSASDTDVIVSFPIIPKAGSIFKDDLVGIKHLDMIKLAQEHWVKRGKTDKLCADKGLNHNISNTIIVDDWEEIEKYVYDNRRSFGGISFMPQAGDKAYNQAPNTEVITAKQMLKKYGEGSIFASGLIVDGLSVFDNLWDACSTAQGNGQDLTLDNTSNTLKKDWCRRFRNFAKNYLNEDEKMAEHCLKDVYLLHKWNKIQTNFKTIDWIDELKEKKFIDVDTLASAACIGGACEI